jgi:hypothetical protein
VDKSVNEPWPSSEIHGHTGVLPALHEFFATIQVIDFIGYITAGCNFQRANSRTHTGYSAKQHFCEQFQTGIPGCQ